MRSELEIRERLAETYRKIKSAQEGGLELSERDYAVEIEVLKWVLK